jgi:peptidyl-prolyl cis-trans isomerase SurA
MSIWPKIRVHAAGVKRSMMLCVLGGMFPLHAAQSQTPVVLDRVVAVVNRQAILASEIDEEIRLSVLEPEGSGRNALSPQSALERLISRALIQQQIRRDDLQSAKPTQSEVEARVHDLRRELPECVHQNCASDSGWNAFLTAHQLTPERVSVYFRNRLELLNFIEQRFRSGIHIPQQDVENFYRQTLLPQYHPGEDVPSLEKVAPRIEEILLQQQVNILFDEWLTNLRTQGDVEVLDPSLEEPKSNTEKQTAPSAEKGSR